MADLTVDPDYLTQLSAQQDTAAQSFDSAGTEAAGIAAVVKATHGAVCHSAATALQDAEQALIDAAQSMKECASALSDALNHAGAIYETTNQQLAKAASITMRGG